MVVQGFDVHLPCLLFGELMNIAQHNDANEIYIMVRISDEKCVWFSFPAKLNSTFAVWMDMINFIPLSLDYNS